MNAGQTNAARALRGRAVLDRYDASLADLLTDLLALADQSGSTITNLVSLATMRIDEDNLMGGDEREADARYQARVRGLPADVFTKNATPGRCDCGDKPVARVPLNKTIADIYGYDLDLTDELWIDVCGACYGDLYASGNLALVLGRDVRLPA